MKYIKITAIIFIFTLCFAFVDINADTATSFIGVKIKNLKQSTSITTENKVKYGQQSAKKYSAKDNLSGDDRAMLGKVTNSSWINLPTQKIARWEDDITYFQSTYTHYVKATKSTFSTVSYSGIWYWDVEV